MISGIQSHTILMEWSQARFDQQNTRMFLESFFQSLAERVYEKGFLGHIKGFCEGEGGDFFKISCVSATTGVSLQGSWNSSCPTVLITLNMNVVKKIKESLFLQMDGRELETAIQEAIKKIESEQTIQVACKSSPCPGEQPGT